MRIATIPTGAPFLETFVSACLDGALGIPFDRASRDFSTAVIYVPTRRAARALAHAFADSLQPRAVLLPRILPLGDPAGIEEGAILAGEDDLRSADLPPAIHPLRRRLMLAALVDGWRKAEERGAAGDGFTLGESFADSFALAGELARIIDEGIIEGVAWGDLGALVDASFDDYWRKTRRFLEIATQAWPAMLSERGVIDAADRRNRLIRAEADRLRHAPPTHPVIAAGSTGSVPATAELLAAIARLPQGAVILPGLDLFMDDAAWDEVAADPAEAIGQPGHPQAALKRLLGRMGASRRDVLTLGAPDAAREARAAAVSASARPVESTDAWQDLRTSLGATLDDGLADVAVIEAADEREEALAIAVALREALESEAATAALVTPDRALADRVTEELRRWGVHADDSAGQPFARTPLGALAELALHAARENFSAMSIIAILASPCLRIDGSPLDAAARATLEMLAFRGVNRATGLDGLARALDDAEQRIGHRHAAPALRRIAPDSVAKARALLALLVRALTPLAADGSQTIANHAAAHEAAIGLLAGERATEGADGEALARIIDALAAEGGDTPATLADYAAVFAAEAKAMVIPPAAPAQGRIKIWGLLEARLMPADRVILGGLNESTWPAAPGQDPFLNRAMRTALGLPLPERRIGQSAHDFAQALGAKEAIIARAMTVEGTPMVASRFLRRLDAFVGVERAKAMRARGERYLVNARALDEGFAAPPAVRPDPRPDKALQPLRLNVTDVALLERDPYAIYARDVLGLTELDAPDPALDAGDRGTAIHAALDAFLKEIAGGWPERPLDRLLAIGRAEFAKLGPDDTVAAFWWPIFESAASYFIADAERRRGMVAQRFAEASGKLAVPLADGAVLDLRGRADLIERLDDGTLAVTDFKTGNLPGIEEVKVGYQPQLTLLAAMATAGAIEGVPPLPVSHIRYLRLGRDNMERAITFKAGDASLGETADGHLARLSAMVSGLRAGRAGFLSRRRPRNARDVGRYDHLARAKEWLAAGSEDGDKTSQE